MIELARYAIPTQETGNALETPPELRVSMDGGDYLLSDGCPLTDDRLFSGSSQVCLPLKMLQKKNLKHDDHLDKRKRCLTSPR
ncbi:hypothetical protein EVAR_22354_1 [Eumeta japonica]|uniref:Uncharacterized protein n=1 Tax=Eumeta variegata TaxID=151549 RepID=A0A4C1VLR7_EUMVA|nr:hypothetical protein EVAR_22354_1 [Eumeta japonica]